MSAITRLVNALTKVPSNPRPPRVRAAMRAQRRPRGRTRPVSFRLARRVRTVNNPAWGRSLPAAYASHVRPRFNITARGATSAIVSGCDLVYPLPNMVEAGTDYLFAVIPSNPAYWAGTRIAQFAPAYMNYRPISMTFSYIPQVAVTQQGTVFMGTLWNGAAPSTNIQQTLFTSNGGCLTQCYVPCDTTITLGSNLQQNLFTLAGDINPDTSPFLFLAGVRGADVVPGYFYVTYTYEFKNPVGQSWVYGNTGLITAAELTTVPRFQNRSIILLDSAAGFGPGTVLDVEGDGQVYYHGSLVSLPSSTALILLYNRQSAVEPGLGSSPIITSASAGGVNVPLTQFTLMSETVELPSGSSIATLSANNTFSYRVNDTTSAMSVPSPNARPAYYHIYDTTAGTLHLINGAGITLMDLNDNSKTDNVSASATFPPGSTVVIEEL